MAPEQYTYFDYAQSADPAEPLAIGGLTDLAKVYGYEPIPAGLTDLERVRVRGAQCQLWTEYVATPAHAEYMLFPRACAFAEVVWSPPECRDFDEFRMRLAGHLARLTALDVNYRPDPGLLAG